MESFVIEKELNLFGGFSKTETSVNQRVIHENPTVFSADRKSDDIPQNLQSNRSDNAKHVLNITTDDALVYISGITFAGGSANLQGEFGDDDASGCGVIAAGRVTFHLCRFDKNSSPENGSAIWADDDGDVENPLKITNVTFVNHAGTLGGVIAVGGDDSDRAHAVIIQNTILANNGADIARNKGNTEVVSAGGNLSVVDNSHQLNHESDIHNTNPLFVDRENGDYQLRNNSPAVNAGVSPAPETDIVGNKRLGNPDIGAYENQNNESNVIGYEEQEFVLEVGPNPATDMLRVEAPEEFHSDYQLSIIGMDGNTFVNALQVTRNQSITEAQVHHLPSGTYIVQIKARNGLVARSLFVKQ